MTPKEQDITEQMVALTKETILATNYFELAREKHLADPGDAILRWFLHCKQKLEGLKRRKNKLYQNLEALIEEEMKASGEAAETSRVHTFKARIKESEGKLANLRRDLTDLGVSYKHQADRKERDITQEEESLKTYQEELKKALAGIPAQETI